MDCKTARQFLAYLRPGPAELEGADLQQLQAHLNVCPECDGLVRAEHALDVHIGAAMREVPTPLGLRDRLVQRLKQERDAYYRKWIGRFLRVAAVAAAAVLIAWFAFFRKSAEPTPIDLAAIEAEVRERAVRPYSREDAESWFDSQKVRTLLPPKFNYNYLAAWNMTEFRGQAVPALVFVRWASDPRDMRVAQVLILSSEQFDLTKLEESNWEPADKDPFQGYGFKGRVWHPVPNHAYVVKYNGAFEDMLAEQ